MFVSYYMRWSGVGIDEWWRNEQFWVIPRCFWPSLCRFPRPAQSPCRNRYQLYRNLQGVRRIWGFGGALYMFKWTSTLLIPPTTYHPRNKLGGCGRRHFLLHQQRLPVVGSGKLFFAFFLGDGSSLSVPQGSNGAGITGHPPLWWFGRFSLLPFSLCCGFGLIRLPLGWPAHCPWVLNGSIRTLESLEFVYSNWLGKSRRLPAGGVANLFFWVFSIS